VAVVLMFAKVVTHRSRKADYDARWTLILTCLHILAVLSSVTTVAFCLLATDGRSTTGPDWHNAAWASLILAGVILVFDVILDAACDACQTTNPNTHCKCKH
jgi:uncharacterized membrane protein YhdT